MTVDTIDSCVGGLPTTAEIEIWLVRKIAALLGSSIDEIDVRKPFANYGLDSAEAVELSGKIEIWLRIRLSATVAWDFPTIESLARHLSEVVRQHLKQGCGTDG